MKDWRPQSVLGLEAFQAIAPPLPASRASNLPAAPEHPEISPVPRPYGSIAPETLMDRCFRELVRFYRHSCCGRLCRGIVHRLNTPLQVLFFQLELLEKKSEDELKIIP